MTITNPLELCVASNQGEFNVSRVSFRLTLILQRFDRFLRNFACRCTLPLRTLRNVQKVNFSKIKDGRRPPFWKLLHAISHQPFDRFWWNLVWRCTLGLPIWRSKMADGGHLKNKKLRYLQNRLAEFWWNFARWHNILVLKKIPAVQKSNF